MKRYTIKSGRRAQSLVEYAFMIALVGLFALIAIEALGNNTSDSYNKISNDIGDVNSGVIPSP